MADTKKKNKEKKKTGSKISNTEWGMVISILAIIDAIQFSLDFIGIPFLANLGTIVNRFIDIAVGFALPTYLHLRGVDMKQAKIIGSMILTFFFEEIPTVDALPLWTADGTYIFLVTKAEEKIKEETGVDVEKAAELAEHEAEKGGDEGTKNNENLGPSDEHTDATGQESDNQNGNESENNTLEEDKEGNEDRQMSDEDSDELEKESDEKSKEGETPEDKEKNKEKGKKNAPAQSGGGGDGGERQERGNESPNRLNLRNSEDERESEEKESSRLNSNLLDLSLSYGERKKQREK